MSILRSVGRLFHRPKPKEIEAAVIKRNLTYLDEEKFASLQECVDSVKQQFVKGDFIEFGVALGGSGIFLAHQLERGRSYFGLDVFGMIPPPTGIDGKSVQDRYDRIKSGLSEGINGEKYYGYEDNLQEVVRNNFASFGLNTRGRNIHLIKGLFSQSLPKLRVESIAIAHVDCDWYEPVKECLAFAWRRLALGGFIVLDDYNDWKGCALATDEFLRENPGAILLRSQPHAVITRASAT